MELRRRSVLGAGAAGLLGALALTGCTPEPQPWDDLGAEPTNLPDQFTAGLADIPEQTGRPLETPEGTYRVAATRVTSTLTPTEVETLLGEAPEEDVRAPEGQAFLIVRLLADFFLWPFASLATADASVLRILVGRPGDGEPSTFELPDTTMSPPFLLRVPEDPAPEDVVLEATTFGRVQRLSLVDGSRISSDVEHIYGRMREVDYSASALVQVIQAERIEPDGARDHLNLDITQIVLTPMVPSLGWPEGGRQLLGAEVMPWQSFWRGDGSGISLPAAVTGRLDLPDGTAVEAAAVESTGAAYSYGQFSRESFVLWFPVPVDLAAATLHLDVQPFPRREDMVDALGIEGGADRALTFSTPGSES